MRSNYYSASARVNLFSLLLIIHKQAFHRPRKNISPVGERVFRSHSMEPQGFFYTKSIFFKKFDNYKKKLSKTLITR